MKVAFVSTILNYPWGGADALWTRAAEAVSARGDPVFLALSASTAEHPRIQQMRATGATLHLRSRHASYGSRSERLKRSLRRLAGMAEITDALRQFSPDLLFLCQGGTYDFLAEPLLVRALEKTRTPYVLICQANGDYTVLTGEDRVLARRFLANARGVVFVSEHNRRLAERQLAAPLVNARVIQNPTYHRVVPQPWPHGGAARLAAVGRLQCFDKGFDVLLPALARAVGEHLDWQLTFFGRGPDHVYLEDLADHCGLKGRVFFGGFVDDVAAIWREHHLLVLPSRIEGCSLAMMEALSSGRPVLATAVGGVDEWIVDGSNGYVCPAHAEAPLAETLRRALAERSRWPEMGRCAAELAHARTRPSPEIELLALANA